MRINNDFWRSILSVTKVSAEAGNPENRSGSLQNLVAGQQVKGEVLARLSDQVYLVKIAGDVYRTELPEPARPGTQLTLTYRTSEPRPEFSLQSTRNEAAPVRLSPTVASLSEVLKGPATQPSLPQVKSLEPLFNSSQANTSALATSLRNALSFSGLFYESHLLQWHVGERLLSDIQKESRLRQMTMAKMANDPAAGENLPAGPAPPDGRKDLLAQVLQNDELPDNRGNITAPAEQLASALLREQVETLLSGVFHWQGSVWQDQEMSWNVEKHAGDSDQEGEQSWKTSIRLTLPNLGEVSATLVSSDEGIKGRITTDSKATKNVMQKEMAGLEENLAGAGLTLISMAIEERNER
ncbi:MAG: flagellar hook-length control protein FliK [Deltaproteobacteria bacterium]|nr:flagellar hook-length control protein FliK [Deltaproteobacteria bacterium]TLN01872.1 MAG: flagellar hook-length control protein FliK [bacterium]